MQVCTVVRPGSAIIEGCAQVNMTPHRLAAAHSCFNAINLHGPTCRGTLQRYNEPSDTGLITVFVTLWGALRFLIFQVRGG